MGEAFDCWNPNYSSGFYTLALVTGKKAREGGVEQNILAAARRSTRLEQVVISVWSLIAIRIAVVAKVWFR